MKDVMIRLFKEEDGQGLSEYGLLVGLIALAVISAVATVGDALNDVFKDISDQLWGKKK
ncbi:Flp/Fap pilin component [Bacillus sp. THAF10]|uniref:Flp family type IVb pilin n=1 Tax=Bacillus sp. THAF10 TaxID=2587848 RepID=UPI001268F2B6|nr:Flp family type IVb pilin [Bacillus sp. THAF10]QFT88464.1 Flp/Fap pilin component [Bacillus sp. THAF10]